MKICEGKYKMYDGKSVQDSMRALRKKVSFCPYRLFSSVRHLTRTIISLLIPRYCL